MEAGQIGDEFADYSCHGIVAAATDEGGRRVAKVRLRCVGRRREAKAAEEEENGA